MAKLTSTEKEIIEKFKRIIPQIPDAKKFYLLGYAQNEAEHAKDERK